jgi:hypothetical protein
MALLIAHRNAPILARRAERVLVEGCRAWIAAVETRCVDCWDAGWDLCAREIGAHDARRLCGDLWAFARAVRSATGRPIATFPYGCTVLSRDECLLLASVAARQNGEPETAIAAGCHLAASGGPLVADAAGLLGGTLQALDQHLLPVPAYVVEEIASRPPGCRFH